MTKSQVKIVNKLKENAKGWTFEIEEYHGILICTADNNAGHFLLDETVLFNVGPKGGIAVTYADRVGAEKKDREVLASLFLYDCGVHNKGNKQIKIR